MDGKKELQHHQRRKMIDFETKSEKFLSEVHFANYLCSTRSRRLERAMGSDFERKCVWEDPLSSGSHFVKSYVDFCILVPFDTDKSWMHEPCFCGIPETKIDSTIPKIYSTVSGCSNAIRKCFQNFHTTNILGGDRVVTLDHDCSVKSAWTAILSRNETKIESETFEIYLTVSGC